MRKKIIVKLLVLSLLVGGLCQWSGGSKAKAASSYWLYGTGLTKSQGGEAGCRIKMYYRGGSLIGIQVKKSRQRHESIRLHLIVKW